MSVITLPNGIMMNRYNWDVIENGIAYSVKDDVDVFVGHKKGIRGAKRRLLARAQQYAENNRRINPDQGKVINLIFNETFYLQYDTKKKQLIIPQGPKPKQSDGDVSPTSSSMT